MDFIPRYRQSEVGFLVFVISFVPNLLLAMGVYREASRRQIRGDKVWFVGPGLWSFAVFLGSVMPAAIYWLMHHSTLAVAEAPEQE